MGAIAGAAAASVAAGVATQAISGAFSGDGGGGTGESAGITREGIAEIRKQLGQAQEDVQPFVELGQRQIPGVERASTVEGLDEILAQIFGTEGFRNLVGERRRGVEGALSAGGLTRSGTAVEELSAVPQDVGLLLENLIFGRQRDLLTGGQAAALDIGGLGVQAGANIGGLGSGQAQRSFLANQAGQNRESELIGSLIGAGGSLIGARGQARVGQGKSFFSDHNLKENIQKIGNLGKLNLYQWDWITEIKDTFIGNLPTVGFIADEVKKIYPEFVENVLGFDAVLYTRLLDKIESETVLATA